jgi:hypothetical protein
VNPETASQIARAWLPEVGAISPPLDRITAVLEKVVPPPDAWVCTQRDDDRLAVLAGRGLWIAAATLAENGDLAALQITRFDLTSEQVRATFSESYPRDSYPSNPEWRFTIGDVVLAFGAVGLDDAPIIFGSRLAQALDS